MQQSIQRMVNSFLLTAGIIVAVQMQRQSGYCFGQNADTGIYRCHLHSGAFRDGLAGGAATEEECIAGTGGAVLRLVPRTDNILKNGHITPFTIRLIVIKCD